MMYRKFIAAAAAVGLLLTGCGKDVPSMSIHYGNGLVYRVGDEYVYRCDEELLKLSEPGEIFAEAPHEYLDWCAPIRAQAYVYNDKLYVISCGTEVNSYDEHGNKLNTIVLPKSFWLDEIRDDKLIGFFADNSDPRTDHGCEPQERERVIWDLNTNENVTEEFGSIYTEFSLPENIVLHSWEEVIARNEDYAAYSSTYDSPDCINICDLETGESAEFDIKKNISGLRCYALNCVSFDRDFLRLALSDSYIKGDVHAGDMYSNDIRDHHSEWFLMISPDGKLVRRHKFRRYERIVHIGGGVIVTYYDGKCITYSDETFEELKSQELDISESDRSVFFEECGGTLFMIKNGGEVSAVASVGASACAEVSTGHPHLRRRFT